MAGQNLPVYPFINHPDKQEEPLANAVYRVLYLIDSYGETTSLAKADEAIDRIMTTLEQGVLAHYAKTGQKA